MRAVWQILHDAGADVVLVAHDHLYERFAPQTADGRATPDGMRQFTVGTGGAAPTSVRVPAALIGFASDRLVPLADLCELQQRLGAPASLEVIETPYGHDGFLKEHERLAPLLREALHECGA